MNEGEMKIYCPICNWVVLSLPALEDHMKRHRGRIEPLLFQCPHCPYSTDKAVTLISHQRTHTDEKPYKCRVCGEVFANSGEFCSHQSIHTKRTRHRYACDNSLSQTGDVSTMVHAGEKTYHCTVCGMDFNQSHHLLNHQRIHTGEKPYKCTVCGKAFARSGTLVTHKRVHTGKKPYKCATCGKAFKQSGALLSHERTHTGEKPYMCADCGKEFAQSRGLVIHKRIHTGERPYKCTVCKKAFAQSGALSIHKRIHTGEKPYTCPTCGKAFSESGTLGIHKRIHTGEKPYECNVCGKSFTHSGTLRVHKRIHTGEKPFRCTTCGKAFSGSGTLGIHKRTHKVEKPYGCAAHKRTIVDSIKPKDERATLPGEIEVSVEEESPEVSPAVSTQDCENTLGFEGWPGVKVEHCNDEPSTSTSIVKQDREYLASSETPPRVKTEDGSQGVSIVKQEQEISPGYEA